MKTKLVFALFLVGMFLSILMGCSTVKISKKYYISTLENVETLPISKEDSAKILKVKLAAEKSSEECHKLHGSSCLDDISIMTDEAQFKGE